ncbi:MAG TPA: SAM-dependent methyltransferase [Kofleriaceae bacterium]|nr:SAM-dependent methyltransferase [Kofleriaceae bacterium]
MSASRTAQYVALYRALETDERRRPPLFRDPYALGFLSRGQALAVRAARAPVVRGVLERYSDHRAPGARTSAIARTAYIDDAVRDAMAAGIDQVVILGAGFDCRAHRMPELAAVRVFEVDRRETQEVKRAHVPGTGAGTGPGAGGVRYVAVDFLRDDVGASLAAAGWDAGRRSLFLWEGVTNYLTEDAVRHTLDWIGTAAAGSRVVFTYIHAGVLDGSVAFDGGAQLVANVRELGEPWTFGLDPGAVAAFVARSGLRLCEDLGADDYRKRYLGAVKPGYRFYRIALAEVPVAS